MERPHYTYFSTRWPGLRLLLSPIHITQPWHYSLVILFAFGLSLAGQGLEQAYAVHEERLRARAKERDVAAVGWDEQAARAAMFLPRVLISYVVMLMAITMDVGIFVSLVAGTVLGFFLLRRQVLLVPNASLRKLPK